MKRRKAGMVCMIIGAVLMVSALSLLLYNRWDARRAGQAASEALAKLEEAINSGDGDGTDTDGGTDDGDSAPAYDGLLYPDADRAMTVTTIDGYDYIGYISIPALGLDLPVMSEWSYPGLKIAPGRFSGSVYSDDMVIAGHNYTRHFGPIMRLKAGTSVYFTDMEGQTWHYEVLGTETLEPTQVEDMSEKKDTDDWDLTLFTCNLGGQTRCAVRCVRVK